jgi:16S rRNA (cytidine1402-2'-O)-methyltransferase
LSAVRAHFESQPPRGEFTLVVAGASPTVQTWPAERVRATLNERISQGEAPSQAAAAVATAAGWPRRDVYRLANEIKSTLRGV